MAAQAVLAIQPVRSWSPTLRTMSLAAAQPRALSVESAVAAARAGDRAAWDVLFDRFHRQVLRYAMARLGEREGAEDVMQDVFVAAVESMHRLRDPSEQGAEAWLMRIAKHKVADRIRALRRDRRQVAPDGDTYEDPGEMAVSRLSAGELRLAMDRLSDDQRDLVLRRFVLDQSLEQVAAATGRPVGAVKSMQHRALASLARLCSKETR